MYIYIYIHTCVYRYQTTTHAGERPVLHVLGGHVSFARFMFMFMIIIMNCIIMIIMVVFVISITIISSMCMIIIIIIVISSSIIDIMFEKCLLFVCYFIASWLLVLF